MSGCEVEVFYLGNEVFVLQLQLALDKLVGNKEGSFFLLLELLLHGLMVFMALVVVSAQGF